MKKLTLIFIIINFLLLSSSKPEDPSKIALNTYAAISIDADSSEIIYEKNCHKLIPMASTTKIMTSLIALNYGNLDEKITVSENAVRIRGCTIGYRKGEEISLKELLYGLMLQSGNDAAIAIAEHIGGSVQGFAKIMNEYAATLGLNASSYESPHGLDSEYHFSSAYDMAMLTKEAMKNETFCNIVSTKSISSNDSNFTRNYNNINKILYLVPEARGVKTGYTGKAGRCLVSTFNPGNRKLIVVTLNSSSSERRWHDTIEIYNYSKKKIGL